MCADVQSPYRHPLTLTLTLTLTPTPTLTLTLTRTPTITLTLTLTNTYTHPGGQASAWRLGHHVCGRAVPLRVQSGRAPPTAQRAPW